MLARIMGTLLVLFGLFLAFVYCASVFRNGWNDGLVRMTEFRPNEVPAGLGALFAIAFGITGFVRGGKRRDQRSSASAPTERR